MVGLGVPGTYMNCPFRVASRSFRVLPGPVVSSRTFGRRASWKPWLKPVDDIGLPQREVTLNGGLVREAPGLGTILICPDNGGF